MPPKEGLARFVCSEIEALDDADKLTGLLANFCSTFGFAHATYYCRCHSVIQEDREALHTTYPKEWIWHYFNHKYQLHDPVLVQGHNSILPFLWDTLDLESPDSREVFNAAQEFGVGGNGLTIPLRGPVNNTAMFSICPCGSSNDWSNFIAESLSDLVYSAHLIHCCALDLHGFIKLKDREHLSRRESEVIRWAARGKTAWETAQILGLKEKTISFYISNACVKLRVVTKTQAVARAIAEGLIWL